MDSSPVSGAYFKLITEEDALLRGFLTSTSSSIPLENEEPCILTQQSIDEFIKRLQSDEFDLKLKTCFSCGTEHFPNYGSHLCECDQCFFNRFPKEEVEEFYKSFLR